MLKINSEDKRGNYDLSTGERAPFALSGVAVMHNGTTKDDLLNIIRYLAAKVKEAAR